MDCDVISHVYPRSRRVPGGVFRVSGSEGRIEIMPLGTAAILMVRMSHPGRVVVYRAKGIIRLSGPAKMEAR